MRKNFLSLVLAAFIAGSTSPAFAQFAVVDAANVVQSTISAISDSFMSADGFLNMVQQLQQLYREFDFMIERAKTWDFSKMGGAGFWGDLLKDASSYINALENKKDAIARLISIYTDRRYKYGGINFSLEDLFKSNDNSSVMRDIARVISSNVRGNMSDTADNIAQKMTPEQKMYLLEKYGMTPESYIYFDATQKQWQKTSQYIRQMSDEAQLELLRTDSLTQAGKVFQSAMEAGEHTEPELLQNLIAMTYEVVKNISTVNENILRLGIQTAYQEELKEQQRSDADRQERYQKRRALTGGGAVDSNF